MQTTPTKEMPTECTIFRWIRTSEMYFSMKQYTVAFDDVAYNVNSTEEMDRVDDLPDSSTKAP